jgi:hypothetical protein
MALAIFLYVFAETALIWGLLFGLTRFDQDAG